MARRRRARPRAPPPRRADRPRGALRFPRLVELAIHDLEDPLATYAAARCPRVSRFSTWLAPELGVAEARAFAAAFPELTDLHTQVADAAHARLIARELAERTSLLRRWTVEFFSDDPTPADAHTLALALPGVTVDLLGVTP